MIKVLKKVVYVVIAICIGQPCLQSLFGLPCIHAP